MQNNNEYRMVVRRFQYINICTYILSLYESKEKQNKMKKRRQERRLVHEANTVYDDYGRQPKCVHKWLHASYESFIQTV